MFSGQMFSIAVFKAKIFELYKHNSGVVLLDKCKQCLDGFIDGCDSASALDEVLAMCGSDAGVRLSFYFDYTKEGVEVSLVYLLTKFSDQHDKIFRFLMESPDFFPRMVISMCQSGTVFPGELLQCMVFSEKLGLAKAVQQVRVFDVYKKVVCSGSLFPLLVKKQLAGFYAQAIRELYCLPNVHKFNLLKEVFPVVFDPSRPVVLSSAGVYRNAIIEKNNEAFQRQWCRLVLCSDNPLQLKDGQIRLLLDFFERFPGLKRCIGSCIVRFLFAPRADEAQVLLLVNAC